MKTLRNLLENKAKPVADKFIDLLIKDGKNAEFEGIKLLNNSSSDTAYGKIIETSIYLYLKYNDKKYKNALNYFLTWIDDYPLKTWGTLALLNGIKKLKDNNSLNIIPKAMINKINYATDIACFYDKENLSPVNLPNNYNDVAIRITRLRTELGFEDETFLNRLTEKFNNKPTLNKSSLLLLDDCPPDGRFDSYSFMPVGTILTKCEQSGRTLNDKEKKFVKKSALFFLSLANNNGDGFCYGRSLSFYGDREPIGILLYSLMFNLLSDSEKDLAIAYIYKIYEKILNFWFDQKRNSVNLWWDGRNTDDYRGAHRLVEINLEFAVNIERDLKLMIKSGIADTEIKDVIPCPEDWQLTSLKFREKPYPAETFILRKKDYLFMLPLVGSGYRCNDSKYMPFPASCRYTEAAPDSFLPFLTPEYIKNEIRYRPIQYYTDIKVTQNDEIKINAKGYLLITSPINTKKSPSKSDYTFETTYIIKDNRFDVTFSSDIDCDETVMYTMENDYDVKFEAFGFDVSTEVKNPDKKDIEAPHGTFKKLICHKAKGNKTVRYKAIMPI